MGKAYDELITIFTEISTVSSIQGLLYWDMNTYMPPSGINHRAKLFTHLSKEVHIMSTDKKIGELILSCENEDLDDFQKRNLELIKRSYDNNTILPVELVGQLASQSNKTLELWKKAKGENNFEMVQAEMEKLLALNIKRAEILAEAKGLDDPFEALLDNRDPGFTIELLDKWFNEVKEFLIPFVKQIQDAETQPDLSFLSRIVPYNTQVELVKDLATFLEYDHASDKAVGRIDEVEHPLTIPCGKNDVRITVNYQEDKVIRAFSAGAHEVGHALDRLQRNEEWDDFPVNMIGFPSFGESQSRFVENAICNSREFWNHYYSTFLKLTDGVFDDISLNDFHFAINAVTPGLIRTQADEVTYSLHIIIRYEIERDLFAGRLAIKDLPKEWILKYKEYLGVDVPSDTEGVMQDLHWYSQFWGYFYGYGIGDIISAQITNKLSQELPDWANNLEKGSFTPIREWLVENIHSLGAIHDTLGLVEAITGEPLTTKYFIEYLKTKYSKLYKL